MTKLILPVSAALLLTFSACKKEKDPGIDEIAIKDPVEEEGTVFDEADLADLFEEDDMLDSQPVTDIQPEETGERVFEESETDATSQTKPAPKPATPSADKGDFLVVAGSFNIKENAIDMERQLKELGYTSASIVYFNAREYHSVVAGEYPTREEAERVAAALRKSGIEAYAHKKRYIRSKD